MAIAGDADIHPLAVVDDGATIGPGAVVGPFCVIGEHVTLGPRVHVKSHAVVTGRTEIGEDCVIFPGACIGEIPQDKKFAGEDTRLIVGARNRIRENVTMNTGTDGGGGITRVGDDGLFLAGSHVAHDCIVGDRVILVNNAALAGHCVIGDDVVIGGLAGVHQFVRIGQGAMIGALTMVTNDVIPYGLVQGPRGTLDGLNLVGLKRRGTDRAGIAALRAAFAHLASGEGPFMDRAAELTAQFETEEVQEIAAFLLADSTRSFLTPG